MLSPFLQTLLTKIIIVLVSVYLTFIFEKYLFKFLNLLIKKNGADKKIDQTVFSFIRIIFRIILWVLVILFILQNMGLQITALLGGLGVAGLATAFAFQKILEDIFSFFLIYFDKPFRVGDFIVVGKDSGTVKNIGIRMTRLDAAAGQELLISNRELTSSRLENFKKMKKRRVAFNFSLSYSTPISKLEKINNLVKDILAKFPNIEADRVHFKTLGESALVFEVVYHVLSNQYEEFMDVQEQINLELLMVFAREKISFAYPTQTIELKK